MYRSALVALAFVVSTPFASAQRAFKPTQAELREGYSRADDFQKRAENAAFNVSITLGWIENGKALWYRRDTSDRKRQFVRIESATGKRSPAFDHAKLASGLGSLLNREFKADELPFNSIAVQPSGIVEFPLDGARYQFDPIDGSVKKGTNGMTQTPIQTSVEPEPNPEYPAPYFGRYQRTQQPEERVRVREGQVEARIGDTWSVVSAQGSYARALAVPESGRIVAFRLLPGDRRPVFLLKSSVAGSTRAALEQRLYDQPGDKLDEYEVWLIDPAAKSESKIDIAPIMGGGQPWGGPPNIQWRGGRGFLEYPVRGYQEQKVVSIDPSNGIVKTVVDEVSKTFIDQSKTTFRLLGSGKELIWQSERDGWNHLYMVSTESGEARQITKGNFVVRNILNVDEAGRQILFTASCLGQSPKDSPYHIQVCRIGMDGTGFRQLTKGDGTHTIQMSPDQKVFVTTYSRVDQAPIHELRRSDTGELVATIEKANIDPLLKNGVRLPERFVAKGRDGKTDIWGIVVKPSNFDPKRKYPVIENIYAGPHDSHVPQGFRPFFNMHRLAELGFIVVQIDGMGTNNRGKSFHDLAWRNVADAGFPDRILWMRALAKKMPQADLERVGIFGTSAGGQSSTGGVLFHPDFYKVAVSSCGCHDNRIDKQWWNEQWMGYPVGPHYDSQSNITNAAKLKGRLMLIVGEQDRNVPPESTFRLVDALVKARKEFELVVIPGADHTDGGPYGNRKRMDFFVRWLHGVEPPRSND